MARLILILDDSKDKVTYHFDRFVRPLLGSGLETEVAKDVQSAESLLRRKTYALAIVESVIHPKPLLMGRAKTVEAKSPGFWGKLFGRKDPAPVAVSIDGLTGRSVSDLFRSAADFLPSFAELQPPLKWIVVCHGRGGIEKEEKARFAACPNVLGVFGWLSTEATAKKVARLVTESAGPP